MSWHFGNTVWCFKDTCYLKTFSKFLSDMPLLLPSRMFLMHIMPVWHCWFMFSFSVDIFTDYSFAIPFKWVQIIRLYEDVMCQWAKNYFAKKSTNLAEKLDLLRCFKADKISQIKVSCKFKRRKYTGVGKCELTPKVLLWVLSTFTYHIFVRVHLQQIIYYYLLWHCSPARAMAS
jgi:hypothetical protein